MFLTLYCGKHSCVIYCQYLDFQLLVTAYDTGVPEITTSAIVTITITRNLNAPVFSARRYEDTVYDYTGVGSNVLQITATDADVTSPENSVIYDLQDNSGFFTIHPFNGMITIDRRLTEDTSRRTVYVVCEKPESLSCTYIHIV